MSIFDKLAEARKEFGRLLANEEGQVGTRRYGYADLTRVLNLVTPVLDKHGLLLYQAPTLSREDGLPRLLTVLLDLEDQSETNRLTAAHPLPDISVGSQAFGSALTYARRYTAVAVLGLTTEADDDGAAASGAPRAPRADHKPDPAPEPTPVPQGWESEAAAQNAHRTLRDRILALPDSEPTNAVLEWRQTNKGWPLPLARFEELERLVGVAETFQPGA